MKKTVLFLFLSLVVMGCKKNETPLSDQSETRTIVAADTVNCIDLTGYHAANTTEAKAEWLRKNGKDVCEAALFAEIEKTHLISDQTMIEVPEGTRSLKMEWGEIKDFMGTSVYNAYISFDMDSNRNITGIKMIPKFDPKITCYSLPLFRSMAVKHNLKDDAVFEFMDARVGTVQTVVVKVLNSSTAAYYDYSDEPGIDPYKSAL